jgi:hypothetical protein
VSELGGLFPGARHQYAKQRLDWVWAAPLNDAISLNVSLAGGGRAGGGGVPGFLHCSLEKNPSHQNMHRNPPT